MAKKIRRVLKRPVWKRSRIREWRQYRDNMTLQELADKLARLDPPVYTTHASLGRIERGLQVPNIITIEAIAKVLRVDVTTMIDHTPSKQWERILELLRNEIEK